MKAWRRRTLLCIACARYVRPNHWERGCRYDRIQRAKRARAILFTVFILAFIVLPFL